MNYQFKIGNKVKLMSVAYTKFNEEDDGSYGSWMCDGGITDGNIVDVEIEDIKGWGLVGSDGNLYPLSVNDHDDFYIVLEVG